MKISITFVTLLFLCHFQWLNANSRWPVFKARPFHRLNVTHLAVTFIGHYMDCSFACLQNMLCVSFNVAVSADDQGKLRCELLPSTGSNHTVNLIADPQFNLYEIKNPCSSEPYLNNGICSPILLMDGTYKCTWHPGYLGNRCEIAAPECYHYNILSEPNRHYSFRRGRNSDDNLVPGWYRFKSSSYSRMIDSCIPYHRCSTDITGWLHGTHPSFEDGIVAREVCFHGYNKCCYRKVQIRVRECKGFYVYKLLPSPSGPFRYCAKE